MNNDILKEKLKNLYLTKKLSTIAISEHFNRSEWWVLDKLKKFGIPRRKRGGGIYLVDLSNKRYGCYSVLYRAENDPRGKTRWVVRCKCGNVREVNASLLRPKPPQSCNSCKPHRNSKGVGELTSVYFSTLRINAKKRGIKFAITMKQIWQLFLRQKRKCALTGLDLGLIKSYTLYNKGGQTASLDRIDPKKGYTINNVRWLHKAVNISKWNFTDEYYIKLCGLVYKHAKN